MKNEISIHAPRMGSDDRGEGHDGRQNPFQSTLPAWGATEEALATIETLKKFQSTLPAWGATAHEVNLGDAWVFQSTLPAWGAT